MTLTSVFETVAPSRPSAKPEPGAPAENGELADPPASGVPLARAIDFAVPEVWRAWARACAEVKRAEARWTDEKWRRAQESALAAAGGKFLTLPWGIADPVIAALYRLDAAERDRDRAESAAWESALARLRAGELRAFGSPETGRAPQIWILPHEWAHTSWRGGAPGAGKIDLSGATYWHVQLYDAAGLPFDQAAIAYSDRDTKTLDLARIAIGRRLLEQEAGNADDGSEDERAARDDLGPEPSKMVEGGEAPAAEEPSC